MSYIFSFVKGDVFISIIRYQYVDRCFSFYLVNTINDVDVGVPSLCWIIIGDEIAISSLITGPVILIRTTLLCHGGILSDDLSVPIVAFCSQFHV